MTALRTEYRHRGAQALHHDAFQGEEAHRLLQEAIERLVQAGPDSQVYLIEWVAHLQVRMGVSNLAAGNTADAHIAYERAMQV